MALRVETFRAHSRLRDQHMRTNRLYGQRPSHQTHDMVANSEESKTRSVVIVEDDDDISDTIKYNLEREGFRVRTAATGEEALSVIFDRPPSLVLLDLNLPQMSGFELCRRLRGEAATARLPVLMLTARTDESDKV